MSLLENLLPDRFEVIGELGRGGTSVVFHAKDKNRDQEVAVKVLLKDSEEDRFQREAERLAKLSHPNVVSFLEVGQHEGRDFLVMEYLAMGDLASYVQNLSVGEILQLFCQICDGLAHLHDRGIVHRDIKPANILVSQEGTPKITDLGVARQMERNTRLTQAGTILGTYSYLAPEQILSSTVGPRADIYSLGICLFISLTGRKPFEADNEFNMLKAHLEETPPPIQDFLPTAPESVDQLVQQMMAKDEADRPRSARAVADLLQDCVRDLEAQDQEDLQPAWDDKIEELPDEHRSVLLAVGYLGEQATFENVCAATPFSEDKTDRLLESLQADKLIDSPTEDSFCLSFPDETIETRLTPRLRKLFASRLSHLTDSQEASRELVVKESSAEVTAVNHNDSGELKSQVVEDVVKTEETQTEEPEVKEPEKAAVEAKPAPPKVVVSPQDSHPKSKPEAPKKDEKKPRWALLALTFLLFGVGLAALGQWYYAQSAAISITSQPSGATVLLNGHEEGVTPLELTGLKPGRVAIALSLDGHKDSGEKFKLGFRESKELHLSLEPLVGKLLLTLEPRKALVTIDGHKYGIVKSDLTLAKGKHKLKVEKKGFQTYESEIELDEGKPLELEVKLEKISAKVVIESKPVGAAVTIDGKKRGKTPLALKRVPFGKHDLAIRMQGHDRFTTLLEVKDAKPMKVSAVLKALPGALSVTSEPSGAKVKINGELKGNTPQTISGLKAGTYTVSISKDGYYAKEEKTKVKAGEKREAHYVLNAVVRTPPPSPPPSYRPPPSNRPPPPPTYRPPPPTTPPPSNDKPWIIN